MFKRILLVCVFVCITSSILSAADIVVMEPLIDFASLFDDMRKIFAGVLAENWSFFLSIFFVFIGLKYIKGILDPKTKRIRLAKENAKRAIEEKQETVVEEKPAADNTVEPEKFIVVRTGEQFADGGFGVQFVAFERQRDSVDESRQTRARFLENREKIATSSAAVNDFKNFEKVENSIEPYTEEERKKDEELKVLEEKERIIRRERSDWLRGKSDKKPEGW